jgi:hypothetical protein
MAAQVALAVIDGGVGALLLAQRAFLVGGGGGDHARTCGLGDLYGGRAHAARRAQHQHGLALTQLPTVDQRMVGGGIGHDEGGRIDEAEAVGQRHAQCGRRQRVGAEAARARQAGHALAHGQVAHAFAHGLDHACILRARHEGQRRLHLVLVLHDQQIGEIQAGRLDFEQHLPGARRGRGQLRPLQLVYARGRGAKPSVHVVSCVRMRCR